MIELIHRGGQTLSLGFGGDTFNTALYLARLTGPAEVAVDYLTLLGDDHYSQRLLETIRAEGIGTSRVGCLPGEQLGLYLVRTDAGGERSFTYYRSQSAARRLFINAEPDIDGYDVVYLSAITLQILAPQARKRLLRALRRAREAGCRVAFDSNYRASGWPDTRQAREAVAAAWELTSVALPTFSDERQLFGDDSPPATLRRLRATGAPEIAVKDGAHGCALWDGAVFRHVPAVPVAEVVDSTAAGDAFNAGYLAARCAGAEPAEAARRAHSVAARVIQHPGAIVAESVIPPRNSQRPGSPAWSPAASEE